ncbi:uncharacterized protein LACBIDRAFT_328832 [Laccaria bicolor S238N-H82]|uniref:Predicted protein n=1 Tax=Laccaria bicolor (strain S238N-H82 / ATCC MYA-4686) TaxID=486041 RepID=B0DG46_LACBS|nr:uncharacterized protein LACBIDRAFT_328832 [Laccaria bicolor S238N-H82]EDR06580.1 predicted protein [Laccaria bicolor S238N-H82]|eukprot:XP_001882952.1 predicted protein [Laccaria bicolor S238N-H82]
MTSSVRMLKSEWEDTNGAVLKEIFHHPSSETISGEMGVQMHKQFLNFTRIWGSRNQGSNVFCFLYFIAGVGYNVCVLQGRGNCTGGQFRNHLLNARRYHLRVKSPKIWLRTRHQEAWITSSTELEVYNGRRVPSIFIDVLSEILEKSRPEAIVQFRNERVSIYNKMARHEATMTRRAAELHQMRLFVQSEAVVWEIWRGVYVFASCCKQLGENPICSDGPAGESCHILPSHNHCCIHIGDVGSFFRCRRLLTLLSAHPRTLHPAMLNINDLPLEMLGLIIQSFYQDLERGEVDIGLAAICLTCKRWNDLALSTPELWSFIGMIHDPISTLPISKFPSYSKVSNWLDRSQNWPLSLVLTRTGGVVSLLVFVIGSDRRMSTSLMPSSPRSWKVLK